MFRQVGFSSTSLSEMYRLVSPAVARYGVKIGVNQSGGNGVFAVSLKEQKAS
jgi:hypothetical protein